MVSSEAANTNLKVFGLTRPGLEQTIYHTLTRPGLEQTIYYTLTQPGLEQTIYHTGDGQTTYTVHNHMKKFLTLSYLYQTPGPSLVKLPGPITDRPRHTFLWQTGPCLFCLDNQHNLFWLHLSVGNLSHSCNLGNPLICEIIHVHVSDYNVENIVKSMVFFFLQKKIKFQNDLILKNLWVVVLYKEKTYIQRQKVLIFCKHLLTWYHRVCEAHLFSFLCCVLCSFFFFLWLVCPMLAGTLDCPSMFATPIFSNDYVVFIDNRKSGMLLYCP